MSTIEPGLILPATPVSASTRIAISRWPVASSGGEPIIPSWRIDSCGMSAVATWPTSAARSRTAVCGAHRFGSSTVLIMSSVIALSFSAGWASEDGHLRVDLGADVGHVPRHEHEHAEEPEGGKGEQEDAASLPWVHAGQDTTETGAQGSPKSMLSPGPGPELGPQPHSRSPD